MRVLYLIFSHDHQEQMVRLVNTIRSLSPDALIAVHHDPVIAALRTDLISGIDNVSVIPNPVHGEWGDYSQIEQFLHAMRWCFSNLNFDWLITLSGLSYPIKPLKEFETMLADSGYDAYVYHFNAFDPEQWPKGTADTRLFFTYFKLPKFRYYYKVPQGMRTVLGTLRNWLNKKQRIFRIMPMPRGLRTRFGIRRLTRPLGTGFLLCGGRSILNLNRVSVARVLEFDERCPQFKAFLKRTVLPDETYFTSIIANDHALRVCNDVLRYIKWPKMHAASGGVIEADELERVLRSPAPFALKFDSRIDSEALDRVDALLGIHVNGIRVVSRNRQSSHRLPGE